MVLRSFSRARTIRKDVRRKELQKLSGLEVTNPKKGDSYKELKKVAGNYDKNIHFGADPNILDMGGEGHPSVVNYHRTELSMNPLEVKKQYTFNSPENLADDCLNNLDMNYSSCLDDTLDALGMHIEKPKDNMIDSPEAPESHVEEFSEDMDNFDYSYEDTVENKFY
jgi:hypothetical protein